MKIVSLKSENFKRLKAVEITPDGNVVVIAGRNAQGKSSVLDSIWAALAGKDGVKEVTRPIRDGESKARVVLELDDLRVERKWTPSGSTLTVGPRDGGAKFNSPQAVLDRLIGSLSFDPLAFAQADPKAQRLQLLELTGLQTQVDELDERRKATYEARTDANREVKRLKHQLELLGDEGVQVGERVDIGAILEELKVAEEKERLRARHRQILEQIKALEAELAEVAEQGRALPGTREVDTLREVLAGAEDANREVDAFDRRQALASALADFEITAQEYSNDIAEIDQTKLDLLKQAPLPVEGLSFDDDGVLYNGVPFRQASAAERLRVSVAMAMAMNPNIRVIRITDGSLLDSENLRLIEEMAREKDFQVWVERVDESGEIGVVIEDGEVRS